jgi:hypothetical protein
VSFCLIVVRLDLDPRDAEWAGRLTAVDWAVSEDRMLDDVDHLDAGSRYPAIRRRFLFSSKFRSPVDPVVRIIR